MSYICQSNYDANKSVLKWAVEQPRLPDAAALALYWMMDPVFFSPPLKEEAAWGEEDYNIVRTVEQNYLKGFYKKVEFGFDPRSDRIMDYDWVAGQGANSETNIPAMMYEAIERPQLDPMTLPTGNEGLPEEVLADMYDWEEEEEE
ncbi:DUF4274 domain-containing protein [Deinococcus cavernae]|uniref:DUF4274 domain-containing protein n=2 Tax=Deinococcus cavernae TaxID=2320857 RepID=A0A418V9J1_9DEIO|nr:DUF4274 domain-containing protein [Deinococcus cavernae]